jgi:hypothetical protein
MGQSVNQNQQTTPTGQQNLQGGNDTSKKGGQLQESQSDLEKDSNSGNKGTQQNQGGQQNQGNQGSKGNNSGNRDK